MKKNQGKLFEQDFKNSFPDYIFIEREKDNILFSQSQNTRFTMTSDYDYRIFNGNMLFLLELKSTKEKSLPFSNFKNTDKYDQLKKLKELSEFKNVITGAIINYRSYNQTYFIAAHDLLNLRKELKSISLDTAKKSGIMIPQTLKRTRFIYDTYIFL